MTSALLCRYLNKTYSFMGTSTPAIWPRAIMRSLGRNEKRKRAMYTLYNMIISPIYNVEHLVTLEIKFFCGHDIDSQ